MRRAFLKRAYRDAVSWFGSENYRKAFKCSPSTALLQSMGNTYRNPFLMRMGTIDEVREALRLKLGSQQSLWDNSLGLTGVAAWSSIINGSTNMLRTTRKRKQAFACESPKQLWS
uniref:Uncharacterized protein n=1 Tax=Babesia bovis TaxID=5865 RepID=S6B1A5_BABBO|nr:hypothetical protein [Babesia bovis]